MFMGDTGSLVIGFILAVNALIIVAGQPINPDPFFVPQNAVIFILKHFGYPGIRYPTNHCDTFIKRSKALGG